MQGFNRRLYGSIAELGRDLRSVFALRGSIKPLMRGESLDPAFRERLFLSVTAVNRCRYCSNYHSRLAFQHGISREEIALLGDKVLQDSPEEQLPALLYAQHWAENGGHASPEMDESLLHTYIIDQERAIQLSIRIIRVANLLGNTWDYVLYRLTNGKSVLAQPSDPRR